ncbi:elongator complex protein 5 isoform X2 [Apium graveolens]|uniref:elongator complex protein 5 isoform X2 n=1 Tax=Apium graveolens TaxID=4045 RepID=UPI003D7B5F7C
MAETICRSLRDGALEGEHAAALTIKDSIYSPFGPIVFNHVLTQLSSFILAGKSQSRALVLITLSQSPSFYADLLKANGIDLVSSHKWLRVLDCYTDPLGWKDQIPCSLPSTSVSSSLCKDVKNLDRLLSSIFELGKGVIGDEKCRFAVAIDSISEMLRHSSMSSVAGFLSNLRSHGEISSVFWLLHEDLHESKTSAALEYMSSMLATIEPMTQLANGLRESTENIPLTEQNFNRGKFNTRLKRRNGRVRVVNTFTSARSSVLTNRALDSNLSHLKRQLLRALYPSCNSTYSFQRRKKMIGQRLYFHLNTKERENQLKFMMAVNPSLKKILL